MADLLQKDIFGNWHLVDEDGKEIPDGKPDDLGLPGMREGDPPEEPAEDPEVPEVQEQRCGADNPDDFSLFGKDLFGNVVTQKPKGPLAERFILPPFSVLDARSGPWQERKRAWLSLGIKSEIGRGEGITWGDSAEITEPGLNHYRNRNKLSPGGSPRPACDYRNRERWDGAGKPISWGAGLNFSNDWVRQKIAEGDLKGGLSSNHTGTSIFDPTLCELAYEWFSPRDGLVLDPFAGGSVRGIVAVLLGRRYLGVDLSTRQVEANRGQAETICGNQKPEWVAGDAMDIDTIPIMGGADFIFSCPPYGDLEQYSDDPRDLSVMKPDQFLRAYREIIRKSCSLLNNHRFACFVVGDYRCGNGLYRNFPGETISAFKAAGMMLYNEAVLLTAVGSLPIRVTKQFQVSRKLGKTHQNVLVFIKGDPRLAAKAIAA